MLHEQKAGKDETSHEQGMLPPGPSGLKSTEDRVKATYACSRAGY